MSELVFAYGSNMCSGRLRAYGVTAEAGRRALLAGYRLSFNKRSIADGSGKANVEARPDSEVWGVLYGIPASDLSILDKGEGGYHRIRLSVRPTNDANVQAWVYVAKSPDDSPNLRPYAWYKRFLVEGAQEHSLPVEYVADLARIEAVEDPDEERDAAKRALTCSDGDAPSPAEGEL